MTSLWLSPGPRRAVRRSSVLGVVMRKPPAPGGAALGRKVRAALAIWRLFAHSPHNPANLAEEERGSGARGHQPEMQPGNVNPHELGEEKTQSINRKHNRIECTLVAANYIYLAWATGRSKLWSRAGMKAALRCLRSRASTLKPSRSDASFNRRRTGRLFWLRDPFSLVWRWFLSSGGFSRKSRLGIDSAGSGWRRGRRRVLLRSSWRTWAIRSRRASGWRRLRRRAGGVAGSGGAGGTGGGGNFNGGGGAGWLGAGGKVRAPAPASTRVLAMGDRVIRHSPEARARASHTFLCLRMGALAAAAAVVGSPAAAAAAIRAAAPATGEPRAAVAAVLMSVLRRGRSA